MVFIIRHSHHAVYNIPRLTHLRPGSCTFWPPLPISPTPPASGNHRPALRICELRFVLFLFWVPLTRSYSICLWLISLDLMPLRALIWLQIARFHYFFNGWIIFRCAAPSLPVHPYMRTGVAFMSWPMVSDVEHLFLSVGHLYTW